jgi:hypothetical protein
LYSDIFNVILSEATEKRPLGTQSRQVLLVGWNTHGDFVGWKNANLTSNPLLTTVVAKDPHLESSPIWIN